ncbi:dihydrofolate reductase family protein [Galbibacter sp. EGI 63066]|uniref:dihydrofolate reductase family protein n=1 Tax=Galbibacter sp. EGI 63066 TaxID=2993559 RepID=UPI002248ADA6|nr:dihydrofolate reductase family protein [Galbibacter sp. EGI 63066]MCX2681570.1 dihydrofolate reductase family protein [Galbibacter sp. EGI 63066]
MNRLILETQISIDGYIADENGGTDWMIWNWGPNWSWDKELQAYHSNLNKSANTILISSQMAQEGFNAHWLEVSKDPTDTRFDFASHIINANKFVASRTLTKETQIPGGWDNTAILRGNLEKEIIKLKNLNNENIIVYGGAELVSFLIDSDLIDEYHLIINPVALGKGLPIFKNRANLEMVNATSFQCGIIVNHYKRQTEYNNGGKTK